ncbi:translation initiation factor IF-2 [Companilactobacillus sp. RD055328]|uniref:translation initiation factor IF-2 n=1 Tax=Companilactobacillus sp. RD055328 TaxID=2916634 RepID=UPI001FC89308|nr:translation initiation factor IF-2 [Companilactobacillus sp. RD055328]GKQ42615.1 translation initiation factor IF-2 [Companilactobacillus sp. RD055328]
MAKKRIYTIAKELDVDNKVVVDAAMKLGLDIKNHMSGVDETGEAKILSELKKEKSSTTKKEAKPVKSEDKKPEVKSEEKQTSKKTTGDDSHKTKIKVTAIRRPEGSKRPGTQNNRPGTQNNRPNNQNNRPGTQNNRPRNNNNANGHANNGNSQTRNNNYNNQRNNTAAPTPRSGGVGAKHLAAFKEHQIKETNNSSNRRPNNNNANNNKRPTNTNNTSRINNKVESRPTTTPKTPISSEPIPVSEKKTNTHEVKRDFNKRNLANPFGSRKKKKNKKRQQQQQNQQPKKEMPQRKDRPLPETLVYTVGMNAQDLGKILHREPSEIVKKLFMLGVMVTQNQSLDKDTIELIAEDYEIKSEEKVQEDIANIDTYFDEEEVNQDALTSRPPVVTIMGHVDHGKTTLLDNLRKSHVTDGEAGGITQHIGAYQAKLHDRLITFLDTPGHAAFSNMRARGADVTDIVILVVAADDGVMPQTIEAINHAKAAGDPIIVAVNKMDKEGANPQHVTEQLMEYELIPESYGGDTIFVNISAKQGTGVEELLEMILLQADVLELEADPTRKAIGTVIEARLDKGRGTVASLLIQQGTLHVGDPIVVGNTFGRVRTMTNDRGKTVKEAGPSMPVEITGLNDVPEAADRFVVLEDEKTARAAGEERAKRALVEERKRTNTVTLDNLFDTMKEGELKNVDVIIKADVQGSVEALAGSLKKIEVEGVRVNIIHQAVGAINESDITLATASNAIVIGFNVRPTPRAKAEAEDENVDIRLHRVIYNAIDEIELAMKGMLEPVFEEKVTGTLTVRETYNVSKIGTIAGCIVDNGVITRDSGVRLIRDGIVVYEGKLASLKRFKDDVKEVGTGNECGITIEKFNDIKIDDQIEAYVMEEVPVQ